MVFSFISKVCLSYLDETSKYDSYSTYILYWPLNIKKKLYNLN